MAKAKREKLKLELQDSADPASCRCEHCKGGALPLLVQTEITIKVRAELRGEDSYVMAGKRCIDQKSHKDPTEAAHYLASVWGLRAKTVR